MRLNVGSGDSPKQEGVINFDINPTSNVDVVGDFRDPLPFEDNYFIECSGSHIIEHIFRDRVPPFLREIYRVLKPEGLVSMIMPDGLRYAQYMAQFYDQVPASEMDMLKLGFYGRPEVEYQRHEWLWLGRDMMDHYHQAGFVNIGIRRDGPPDLGLGVSLPQTIYAMIINGYKP